MILLAAERHRSLSCRMTALPIGGHKKTTPPSVVWTVRAAHPFSGPSAQTNYRPSLEPGCAFYCVVVVVVVSYLVLL
jgi:hypothetical protein